MRPQLSDIGGGREGGGGGERMVEIVLLMIPLRLWDMFGFK